MRPDRVGGRMKYLMSHNLSKCMKFYFILMPRQQHSVPIRCFSHELLNAYSEMNSATLLQQMKCKISHLLTSHKNVTTICALICCMYCIYINVYCVY